MNSLPPASGLKSLSTDQFGRPAQTVDGSAVVVRMLDAEHDLSGVCQLFSDVFSQPMDTQHWRWKYMQAPGSQHYHALAAHAHTGMLLGHIGVIVLPGLRGKQAIRMAHATDLMVSPLARTGLGPDSVFRHMMHTVRERALGDSPGAAPLFMYGFQGQRPATLGMRLGIQRRLQVCTEYTSDPAAGAGPVAPAVARQGLWTRFQQRWQQRGSLRLEARAQPPEETAWSDAVLNSVWQRQARALAAQDPEKTLPGVARTAAYLRWRYLHHPQQQAQPGSVPLYTLWLLGRPSRSAEGWLVTCQTPHPTVVDSCLPGDAHGNGAWLAAALQALGQQSPGPWTSWLPHPGAHARATPIWATAMQGAQFHDHWPSPAFQPGDTDVF